MERIRKKLVFHFYIGKEGIDTECNQLHFKCLEHYAANVFNSVVFVIAVDDVDEQKSEILNLENKITDIFKTQELEFKIVNNTYLRDTKTFYDEIATKIKDTDDLILFAHNKGTTNVKKFEKLKILKWVGAMYFSCFHDINEVEISLTENRCVAYGGLLNVITKKVAENFPSITGQLGKNRFLYTGTFFWLNPGLLCQYMENNEIDLPEIKDRWYAENFLANIVPEDMCTSPNDWRALNYLDAHDKITNLIKMSFMTEKLNELNNFYKEMGIVEHENAPVIEIIYIATNDYINYLNGFLDTIKYFYPGAKKILKILTNKDINIEPTCEDVIKCDIIKIFDLFYPCINLHKAKFIEQIKHDESADYIFYFDADTKFIDNPKYDWESLKNSMDRGFFVMSAHPIYLVKDEELKQANLSYLFSAGVTDKVETLAPYIPADTYTYVISSFFCGKKDTILHVCKGINEMIESDMVWKKWYHIPRYSDENYFNKLVYNRENNIDKTYCIRVGYFNCIFDKESEMPSTVFMYQKGINESFKSVKK